MTNITKKEIESKASDLIKDFSKHQGKTISVPTPVFEMAEFLGYHIDFRNDGIYEDLNILGGLQIKDRIIEINENLGSQEGRMHFTVAHEIGHLLMHTNGYEGNEHSDCKQDEGMDGTKENNLERQADLFAAHLLMPSSQMKNAFFTLRKKPIKMTDHRFFGLLKKKRSKRQRALFVSDKIRVHGGFENVSKLAFLNRLIGMGLVRGISVQKNINLHTRSLSDEEKTA